MKKAKSHPRKAIPAKQTKVPAKSYRKPAQPKQTKVPAYRYSLRNRTTEAARDRLEVLKEFGVKFGFAVNAKLTPQRKAAITRVAKKYTEFLNPKNGFEFVKLTPAVARKLKQGGEVSEIQVTEKGAFIPVPKSIDKKKSKGTVRVTKAGHVETKTGKFTSTFKQFDALAVVRDPSIVEKAAAEAGAERVFISIKGHRGGTRKNGYSVKAFMRYVRETIVDDIESAQEDEEIETPSGRQKSAFKNRFGVEFVTYDWRKRRKK